MAAITPGHPASLSQMPAGRSQLHCRVELNNVELLSIVYLEILYRNKGAPEIFRYSLFYFTNNYRLLADHQEYNYCMMINYGRLLVSPNLTSYLVIFLNLTSCVLLIAWKHGYLPNLNINKQNINR